MKTTMRNISKVLLLALPFLTACQKDMEADRIAGLPDKGEVEEGCFVVDYTTDEATATRGLDASCRIQSLDYLVYENSGEEGSYILKKRRSIPDIKLGKTGDDGEIMERGTSWPLTRENMTWAQREALKDTLLTSCNYKVVFVANAATDIWKEEVVLQNADEIGVDKFEDGRLFLPTAQTFDDSNMYYMWTGELKGSEYSKETPASKQIVLERMINRVEVKLDETVAQRIEEQGVDNYVNSQLAAYFDENYVKDDNMGKLDRVVSDYIDGINNQLEVKGFTDYESAHFSTNNFKTKILSSSDNKKKVVKSLICNNSSCKTCVKHTFVNEMNKDFSKYYNWGVINSAKVNYRASSYPQTIGFDRQTKAESSCDNSIYATKMANGNHLLFYTFGNNDTDGNINFISSISFYDKDETLLFDVPVNMIPANSITGGNRFFVLVYNPSLIEVSTSGTFYFKRENFNLKNTMDWDWEDTTFFKYDLLWSKGDMEDWLNDGIYKAGISGDYDNMILELDIPKVEIVNPWTSSVNN